MVSDMHVIMSMYITSMCSMFNVGGCVCVGPLLELPGVGYGFYLCIGHRIRHGIR